MVGATREALPPGVLAADVTVTCCPENPLFLPVVPAGPVAAMGWGSDILPQRWLAAMAYGDSVSAHRVTPIPSVSAKPPAHIPEGRLALVLGTLWSLSLWDAPDLMAVGQAQWNPGDMQK